MARTTRAWVRWSWAWALVLVGILGATPGCAKKERTEPITGDPSQTVAEVGGEKITLAEVNQAVKMLRSGQINDVDPNAPELELQKRAVDDLLSQRVVFVEAKKTGHVPTEQEVQDAIAQFVQSRFPSDSVFTVELQRLGLSREEFAREYQRNDAVNRHLRAVVEDTIQVTPEQARSYYDSHPNEFVRPETVHARHILIRADQAAAPDQAASAETRVRQLHRQAVGGTDFALLAAQHSEDPGSAQNGGDLSFFARGQMVPPFDSVAFALAPGQISEPVRTQFGWHIIKVEERSPAGTYAFEEIAPRLQMMLQRQRAGEQVQAYIEGLKKNAKIKRKV